MTTYVLDPSCRRLDRGRALLGGSPLRLFRLSPSGVAVIDRLVLGDDPAAAGPPAAVGRLLDRLLDAGAIHPRPTEGPFHATDVTVVIPAFGVDVSPVVGALGEVGRVLVVDDGSWPPLAPVDGAELVRRATNGGPGAARMTAMDLVDTPLVAFVDADVVPRPGWLEPLLAHLGDPRVGLAAPRVASRAGAAPVPGRPGGPGRPTVLARYEAARSPLDLGPVEGRVRARTRISYVPAAALLVRTEAVRAVGGFATDLRVGEDVDLVWRLDEAGWRCRYDPRAVVDHQPRPTLAAWAAQRMAYGRSAAPLALRHPGALAPAAVSGWSAGAWALTAAGRPVAAAGLTLGTSVALARKLRSLPRPLDEALRLAGLGTLGAGGQLASAVTRVWWPLAGLACLGSRRARRAVLAATLVPPVVSWLRRPPSLDLGRYTAMRIADDLAYGLGVWQGCVEAGTVEPLLPDLASWPRPGRYAPHRAS